MSDKNIKDSNIDMDLADAEFDAFLQGGDELALLLQDLPQDTPSAELDAAIMADAAAALTATSSKPAVAPVTDAVIAPVIEPRADSMLAAANDAQNPEASRHRPSFLWRWKTPLGLAASVMLAVPLFFSHQEHEAEIEAANTGPAPEKIFYPREVKNKEIVPVPAVAEMAQAAPMPQRQPDTERKIAAKDVATESSVKSERRADVEMKPAPVIVADTAAKPVLAAPPMPVVASPAPVVIAEAPPPAPKAAAAVIANEKMPEVVRAAEAERARNTDSFKVAAREEAPRHLAKVAEAEGRLQTATPPVMARSAAAPAAPAPAAAPAAAPVYATAPAPRATMDSMVADKKLDVQGNSPARVIVPLPLQSLAPLPPAPLPDAPDWLAKIEKLLKEKQHQEALEEWKKFRTTYPNFVVDKSLQKQIDVLQK
ncbi:hypothetical protein [Undibacterium pigrum]|uniref:Uncharacterized protein n=1 Tax=Undibacterium pigrum TaxID=401470 RepID=A0A318JWT5_9BURK|nr:hypothetical protein [Undibacterium pigrum]PXX45175.1 hypothetical protein DFR42_102403 [Undibacterium pigrum]